MLREFYITEIHKLLPKLSKKLRKTSCEIGAVEFEKTIENYLFNNRDKLIASTMMFSQFTRPKDKPSQITYSESESKVTEKANKRSIEETYKKR